MGWVREREEEEGRKCGTACNLGPLGGWIANSSVAWATQALEKGWEAGPSESPGSKAHTRVHMRPAVGSRLALC